MGSAEYKREHPPLYREQVAQIVGLAETLHNEAIACARASAVAGRLPADWCQCRGSSPRERDVSSAGTEGSGGVASDAQATAEVDAW